MWLDEFPAAKDAGKEQLTPAQIRALIKEDEREERLAQPAFGAVPLVGQPARTPFTQQRQRGSMAYAPIQSIVAGVNSRLGDLHNQMGNEVEDAIQRENESRVAQNRELRRMAHEQELERMRQQTKQQEIAALIARLDAQSGKKVMRFPGGMITHG